MSADMRAALEQARRALAECSSAMEDEQNDAMIGDAMSVIDEALASQAAQGEAVGFRYRVKGSPNGWSYADRRAPDSFELRECEIESIYTAPPAPAVPDEWSGKLAALRAAGWAVAVHNDYRLNGEAHTFWLFTREGKAIKGEGRTDDEALTAAMLAAAPEVPRG